MNKMEKDGSHSVDIGSRVDMLSPVAIPIEERFSPTTRYLSPEVVSQLNMLPSYYGDGMDLDPRKRALLLFYR